MSVAKPDDESLDLASSRKHGFVVELFSGWFVENCTGLTIQPMTNEPSALSNSEIEEIASNEQIQEMWGAHDSEEMELFLKQSYAVKFDFVSGCPGYVGELFLIQGDALDGEVPPVRLIRSEEEKLEILR
jgi:hypothetical protein